MTLGHTPLLLAPCCGHETVTQDHSLQHTKAPLRRCTVLLLSGVPQHAWDCSALLVRHMHTESNSDAAWRHCRCKP